MSALNYMHRPVTETGSIPANRSLFAAAQLNCAQQHHVLQTSGSLVWDPKLGTTVFQLVKLQVQRLIAVLSVPGVSRRKLLEDSSLDPGPDLTAQERKQLEAAGWRPGTTIRSLLNFTGAHAGCIT